MQSVQLEWAGWGGFVIVCAMTITIIANACYNRMPYVGRDGKCSLIVSDSSCSLQGLHTFAIPCIQSLYAHQLPVAIAIHVAHATYVSA